MERYEEKNRYKEKDRDIKEKCRKKERETLNESM